MIRRKKEVQRKEIWEKIENSKYNVLYKWIKEEGVPQYLKNGWRKSRWQRVARYRLGNEMRENKYWVREEERICVSGVE